MNAPSSDLHATISLATPNLSSAADLLVKVVITNSSDHPIRINSMWMGVAQFMLKVRRADATPVHPGPPPTPIIDDGTQARVTIAPQRKVELALRGSSYFAGPIAPGTYQVRFHYENAETSHGDWTGKLETPWVPFVVNP